MREKNKQYKGLVHLGEFKNKLVYYDLKGRKLYFSILERTSKSQQYFTLSLILLVLPFIRFLNGLTIFSIAEHKYIYLILFYSLVFPCFSGNCWISILRKIWICILLYLQIWST